MLFRKTFSRLGVLTAVIFLLVAVSPVHAYSSGTLLRPEMQNQEVTKLQRDLKVLGFFDVHPTGYFGSITEAAVMDFQKENVLSVDGLAGPNTISQIQKLTRSNSKNSNEVVTRGSSGRSEASRNDKVQLLDWFDEVKPLWQRGEDAVVTDLSTGAKFNVKRTYGRNHADVEPLTKEDTQILKQAAGGSWNWVRRPVIVELHGQRIAASLTAMPHAGIDGLPTNQIVNNRSGGFGRGTNLNAVHGNGMHGHIDIHFPGSRTHGSNSVCSDHQQAVRKAYNAQ